MRPAAAGGGQGRAFEHSLAAEWATAPDSSWTGLVGETRRGGAKQRPCDNGMGGEVQAGEEEQLIAEVLELRPLGLLDLDRHLPRPRVGPPSARCARAVAYASSARQGVKA